MCLKSSMLMENHTCDQALLLLKDAKKKGEKLKAIATGAGVPYQWLVRFARGDFEDPGSRKVEDVYRYLDARQTLARGPGAVRCNASAT
jgi:hypothetical protein